MAPPRKWRSEAARKAAQRDRRKGIEHPPDYYNQSRSAIPERQLTYVIQAETGQLKIGIAVHPEARLRDLQTGSPVPLRLLGTIPAGRAVEALLHETFKAHRLVGEWYSPEIHDDVIALLSILGSANEKKESGHANTETLEGRGGAQAGVPREEEGGGVPEGR